MHEFGIATSALAIVLEHARRQQATRIVQVTVRVGSLAGVDPEALRFAFDAVVAGTPAAGAALVIEDVTALAHCAECDVDFTPDERFIFTCPTCGQLSGDVRRGRELELARIELST